MKVAPPVACGAVNKHVDTVQPSTPYQVVPLLGVDARVSLRAAWQLPHTSAA